MEQKNNNSSSGIGFTSLLTLLFIGLKLTGYISWSWWWVLFPVWGSFAFVLIFWGSAFLWLKLKYRRYKK